MSNSKKKKGNRIVGVLLTLSLAVTTASAPFPGRIVDTYAFEEQGFKETGQLFQPVKVPVEEGQIVKVTDQSQLRNTKKGTYYQLQNDLVSEGSEEIFQGILDGNGHTITLVGKPLFQGVEKDGIIQNTQFEGTVGTPEAIDGPLGRFVKGAVLNCSSAITGETAVGFASYIEEGVLSNCIAYGKAGKGALLSKYGGVAEETEGGKVCKGKISATYWIATDKDPVIDPSDLLDGSSAKTETEFKAKDLVTLLNQKRGTYGTPWGQNATTGYPCFGEEQTSQPDQPQVLEETVAPETEKIQGNGQEIVAVQGAFEPKNEANSLPPTEDPIQQKQSDGFEQSNKGKETAAQYLLSQHAEIGYQYGNEWELFTLLRAGYQIPQKQIDTYYESVVQQVKTWDETVKPTDVERVVLTLLMLEKEITNVDGVNLAQFIYNSPKLTEGTNELCWALLALDAKRTTIPEDAKWTREKMVAELLKWQNADGGFPLFLKGESGIDTTAMVLQSLAPYREQEAVKNSIDQGFAYLSKSIQSTFDGGNAQATAQILLTLSVFGKDAASENGFSTKEKNTITSLMEYQDKEGFKYTKDSATPNPMANIQALQGLDAYEHFVMKQEAYWDLSKIGEQVDTGSQPDPTQPEQPEKPEQPVQPEQPAQPEKPVQPARPEGTSQVRPVVLTDKNTGIILTGEHLERSMKLKVTPLKHTDRQVDLMRAKATKTQWIVRLNDLQLWNNGTQVTNCGTMTVYLPLSKVYTGNTMTVLHCVDGSVELLTGEVIDGFVKIEVSNLQGFGIIIEPAVENNVYKKIA